MHPRMMTTWRRACGCDRPARTPSWGSCREHHHYAEEGSGFGVRRPLRFLAYRLELDEPGTYRWRVESGRLIEEAAPSDSAPLLSTGSATAGLDDTASSGSDAEASAAALEELPEDEPATPKSSLEPQGRLKERIERQLAGRGQAEAQPQYSLPQPEVGQAIRDKHTQ